MKKPRPFQTFAAMAAASLVLIAAGPLGWMLLGIAAPWDPEGPLQDWWHNRP